MLDMMLTTVDNPFDPFTQWDEWYQYDQNSGYHTPSLLARVVITSDDLSEADQDADVERAMKEIVRENVSTMHRIVQRDGKILENVGGGGV